MPDSLTRNIFGYLDFVNLRPLEDVSKGIKSLLNNNLSWMGVAIQLGCQEKVEGVSLHEKIVKGIAWKLRTGEITALVGLCYLTSFDPHVLSMIYNLKHAFYAISSGWPESFKPDRDLQIKLGADFKTAEDFLALFVIFLINETGLLTKNKSDSLELKIFDNKDSLFFDPALHLSKNYKIKVMSPQMIQNSLNRLKNRLKYRLLI